MMYPLFEYKLRLPTPYLTSQKNGTSFLHDDSHSIDSSIKISPNRAFFVLENVLYCPSED